MVSTNRLADLVEQAGRDDASAPAELASSGAGAGDETGPVIDAGVLGDHDVELFKDFLGRVEEACDQRYRLRHGDAGLVRQLAETFQFLRVRKRGDILVRAVPLKPDPDRPQDENTLLEIVLEDQPFIVDTARLFLSFAGLRVVSSLYLSFPVRRDRRGRAVSLGDSDLRTTRETLVRFEVAGRLDEDLRAHMSEAMTDRLEVSRVVVRDFKPMKSAIRQMAKSLKRLRAGADKSTKNGITEARALTEWLLDDHFVLMGVSLYPLGSLNPPTPDPTRQLGHTRLSEDELAACGVRIRAMENASGRGSDGNRAYDLETWVVVYKSQEESLIHRAGKIDNILIRGYDEDGTHIGYYHLRGLFTFKAIQTPGGRIPLVRQKLERLLAVEGLAPHSLKWKSFATAFNSIPVEFSFESPVGEIATIVQTILTVERDKELRSHVVIDRENRKGLYFLVLPRESYSEELRSRLEGILIDGIGATYSDSRVHIGKHDTVLLSFFFTATRRFRPFTREQLDERVRSVAGTWEERFYRELESELGSSRAQGLFDRYRSAFPEDYKLHHPPAEVVADVTHLEAVRDGDCPAAFEVFFSERDRRRRMARLRVYLPKNVYLSKILPMLDNFGLQIVDQSAFHVQLANGGELYIETFRVAGVEHEDHNLIARKPEILDALQMVFREQIGNDALNRLTYEVGLPWRDVDLFRSYLHYLRQLGIPNTVTFMANTVRQHAGIAHLLLDFYRARFSPELGLDIQERQQRSAAIAEEVRGALHEVRSSAQDNLLRLLLNLFDATLRTSRYQKRIAEEHSIAFKVDCDQVMVGSEPRAWREIYVHHYGIEGVHLRGGPLARGGIRWSDRVSDYREEILGLMRTQMVKNVLIVPVGAKGGFILRKPPSSPEDRRNERDRMYKIFINSLLDLTDNVIDGAVVHPDGVIAYDGEDSYLVVAADKGTAHLSDTANEISAARGFWLGDAFASGGTNGYDHKALGITARGAWEGTRRHFREMGLDSNHDAFTVAGIGDMSGDVFGNGMLLARNGRLLAAFNHLHIFIDPSPDADRSYAERQRLFEEPHSTWKEYSPELFSQGGGVYDRQAKMVILEPEAKELLGLSGAEHRPEEVIRHILTLEVDLLWNGGVGTYIKASHEDNRDVGDLANQDVRVDAGQVRARVVGEGGNLGVTQAGRIEYALAGGRINTDFVDNSGGVDCSDHEVNLKILLAAVQETDAEFDTDQRNVLLKEIEGDVCQAVLRNNFDQCLMLSFDELRSRSDPFSFERTIKGFEDRGLIVRDRDHLPSLETLVQRQTRGQGLTRPELAMIGAFAKMEISRRLLEIPAERITGLDDSVTSYFPDSVVERFGSLLPQHLLRCEIGVTRITNMIIDHAGSTFFFDVERETGASVDRLVRAYLLADELFQLWGMKEKLLDLDGRVPVKMQYRAITDVEETVHRTVAWLLSGPERGRLDRIESERASYRDLVERYAENLPAGLTDQGREQFQETEDLYYGAQFDVGLPERLARFCFMTAGLRIADICHLTGAEIGDVIRLYFQIGEVSTILPLVRRCETIPHGGRWDTLALRIIRNSFLDSLWALTQRQVRRIGPGSGKRWVLEALREMRNEPFLGEIKVDLRQLGPEEISIAGLQVMSARIRSCCGG